MGKHTDTPYSISVNFLAQGAADRADMLRDDGTGTLEIIGFANPSAIIGYISYELAALWDLLIATYEDYAIQRKFITVLADKEDYALPDDFYKFRKVFPIVGGRRCTPLRKFNLERLGEADSLGAILASPIEETEYSVRGMRLWLHPIPSNAGQLELWYVPQFKYLENLEDLVPAVFPNGWEEYVIEGVAARLLEKEESDASPQRARQQQILQRIMILAEDRDAGQPHQMQDVEGFIVRDYRWHR